MLVISLNKEENLSDIFKEYERIVSEIIVIDDFIERFDDDFVFQLTDDEFSDLKCQIGTARFSKVRTNPNVFTEQGVYMLATVVNSDIASDITKSIMRTFTKLRKYALQNKDIYSQLESLKKEIKENKSLEDQRFESIKNAIVTLENMILEIDQAKSVKQVALFIKEI